jgi:hypothetical protein
VASIIPHSWCCGARGLRGPAPCGACPRDACGGSAPPYPAAGAGGGPCTRLGLRAMHYARAPLHVGRAGAYGSSSGSAINTWASIANRPDDIYFGEWNKKSDTNSNYIDPGYWINNQRHHQYDVNVVLPTSGWGRVSGKTVNPICSQGHVAGNGYGDGVPNSCP